MISIDSYILDPALFGKKFACDLGVCKGACCTLPGGAGAPVKDAEVEKLTEVYPIVKKYLPTEHVELVEAYGFLEGGHGNWTTRCYKQRACVFVMYKEGIARCAIQYAYLQGEVGWIKPQSCHLFPIRIREAGNVELRFEWFDECEAALIRGEKEGIPLLSFLREPIERVFGKEFYARLEELHPDDRP